MAAALGYDPRALHGYLRRTFRADKLEPPGTHPPLDARLMYLEGAIENGGIEALYASVHLKPGVRQSRRIRFRNVMDAVIRFPSKIPNSRKEKG